MDIKKTISSITVSGSKDSAGRDFRTQLNIALDEVCSQAGVDVQKNPDGKNVSATLPWGTVLSIGDLHRDIEGSCSAVLFFHEPRAHPSRNDSHGRSDRFLFLR